MELPIPILQTTSLFHGMTEEEIRHLIRCLATPVRRYGKGAFIWHAGEKITHAGIVLSGTVDAVQYHDDGTVQLVARQTAGGVFGDLLMASGQPSPVSLLTTDGAEVLFLPLDDILTDCGNRCPFHIRLRHNLLQEFIRQRQIHMAAVEGEVELLPGTNLSFQAKAAAMRQVSR